MNSNPQSPDRKELRLLIIPSHFGFGGKHGLGASGAGVFVRDQAIALSRGGHVVTVLYVHFDGARVTLEEEFTDGVRFLYVHARPSPLRMNFVYKGVLMGWACWTKLRSAPPHIIHAHNVVAGFFAKLIGAMWHVPYVLTEHSPAVIEKTPLRIRFLRRLSYSGARRLVAVSDGLATAIRVRHARSASVVPNLVAQEFFEEPLPSSRDPRRAFQFISIGKSDHKKGWDLLILAFKSVLEDGFDADLTLCGGGNGMDNLAQMAKELGVLDRVRFLGFVDHERVRELMRDSDCHVMPSRVETFGIASIEALALGKPIVMTDTFAAASIVRDWNGIRVGRESSDLLAEAMTRMIRQQSTYDAPTIREDCRQRFSGAVVVKRLESIYAEVLS